MSSVSVTRSGNVNVTLVVPASVPDSGKVQFSVAKSTDPDSEIFLESKTKLETLTSSHNGRVRTMWLRSGEIPRFRADEDVVLRAHFWKKESCLENVDLGVISF